MNSEWAGLTLNPADTFELELNVCFICLLYWFIYFVPDSFVH